jgi:mannose-6-phosphate isomerase-like protein (cupin superfamily)
VIRVGDRLHNPVTLEEFTFLETSRQTNGARTRVRISLPPRAPGVFLHLHTTYTEHFLILEGQLTMIAGDPKHPFVLSAGQSQLVPLNTVHRFWNDADAPVTFEVEILPARRFEETIETLFELANLGRVKPDGSPEHPFDLALLAQMSESYLPGPPVWAQRALFALIALIARLVGYRTFPVPRRTSS